MSDVVPQHETMSAEAQAAAAEVQAHVKENDFVIETKDLKKTYGRLHAIKGISLQVPRGSIYGFVGPNGAGKTSTMRILTTLMRPSSGEATVNGYSVTKNPREVRRSIGYMPDFFGVYEDMKVWEYLDFFAACYEIPANKRMALIDDLLELVDLKHRRDDMVDKLSRGMKQRLCLARTLAHDPQVLILDEPASGLDARARVEIRELLIELAKMGKTIFFSTHILADVDEICTHVGILEAGEMVLQGPIRAIREQIIPHRAITITLLGQAEEAKNIVSKLAGVLNVKEVDAVNGRPRIEVQYEGSDEGISAIVQALTSAGISVVNFAEEESSLEKVFMKATKGIIT
jgi:ABC-2 type transport system ATP-binding protein